MAARAQLPKAVHAVGDRIGLEYGIDRKAELKKYIERNQDATRLDYDQLRNSNYSLNESKTKKVKTTNDQKTTSTNNNLKTQIKELKNPLKLNSKIRKQLYTLSHEEKQDLLYTTFERVHDLWKQYSSSVLSHSDPMSLFRMDLHGCKLKCVESRNPNFIGLQGIVVQETKNTFLLIKESNGLVTVPKRECKFEFRVNDNEYVINGANFLYTSQTRSKLKYKKKKSS